MPIEPYKTLQFLNKNHNIHPSQKRSPHQKQGSYCLWKWRCWDYVEISDDAWCLRHIVVHSICMELVLLDSLYSLVCILLGALLQASSLPALFSIYHASHHIRANSNYWNFPNQLLCVAEMSSLWFLDCKRGTLPVISRSLHTFCLRA